MAAKNTTYLHNWESWSHGLKRFGYDHCFAIIYKIYNKSQVYSAMRTLEYLTFSSDEMTDFHMDKRIDILHFKNAYIFYYCEKPSFDSHQKMHKKCQELVVLRWLETVSSTFQDFEFDGSLQPLYTC